MFEAFPGSHLQNCHWFCVCATTALCKNRKYKKYSGTELCGSLMSVMNTPQMLWEYKNIITDAIH